MANLDPMMIDNFARITCGDENYAVYRLQQNGGDINAALETHFGGDIDVGFTQDSEDELNDIDVEEKTFPRELYTSIRSTNLLADANPNATANLVEVPVVEWHHYEVSEHHGYAPYAPAFNTSFHDSHDTKGEMIQDAIAASKQNAERPTPHEAATIGDISVSRNRSGYQSPRTSSFLEVQRSIREQQDEEYYASLRADREKEINEAYAHELKMQTARYAAYRKLEDEHELERQLTEKEALLLPIRAIEEENVVTTLIRMPDGTSQLY